MEYFDQIEIKGQTARCAKPLTHAGEIYGYDFEVCTEYTIPAVSEEGPKKVITWHMVKFLAIRGTKSASFRFRPKTPIHVIGRIHYTTSFENGQKIFSDVYIEARTAEYLDEKKEG